MLISNAYAEDAVSSGVNAVAASPISGLMPFLLILVVFYFLVLRPQQKKFKEQKNMLDSIKKGDKILTGGGIIGDVSKVEDDIIHIKIAESVIIKVSRSTINNVTSKDTLKNPKIKDNKKSANDN